MLPFLCRLCHIRMGVLQFASRILYCVLNLLFNFLEWLCEPKIWNWKTFLLSQKSWKVDSKKLKSKFSTQYNILLTNWLRTIFFALKQNLICYHFCADFAIFEWKCYNSRVEYYTVCWICFQLFGVIVWTKHLKLKNIFDVSEKLKRRLQKNEK